MKYPSLFDRAVRGLCHALVLLSLLVLPAAAAGPLLVGVVPDLPGPGPGDEGVAVASDAPWDPSGYRFTDGEDTWTIPSMDPLAAGEVAWFVGDPEAWRGHDGPAPVASFGTVLRLGNDGDDVRLLAPDGTVLDGFAYGDGSTPGQEGSVAFMSPGLVYLRNREGSGWVDTDRAADWVGPRVHRIGQSALDAPTFTVHRLTAYSSPDSSFGVLTDLLDDASKRVRLHVYDLRSQSLGDHLVDAAARGVDVVVMTDQAPVGLRRDQRDERDLILARIEAAGGTAWLAGHGRYDYHHLKVLVVDDAVAVQSENWVASGVPEDPSWGNRGWGVVVHDAAVADWFDAWMAADRAAWDTKPFTPPDPLPDVPRYHARSGGYAPVRDAVHLEGTFTVIPVVAPDASGDPAADPVLDLVRTATDRVWVEQLDLRTTAGNVLGWGADDGLFTALGEVALRGVDTRVLVAPPFDDEDTGNTEALAALTERIGAEGRFSWGVLDRPGIATVHNKGLLVDDAVVVGSMNQNHHSRSENREVDLIVRGPGVADFFASLFLDDWEGRIPPRDWGAVGDDLGIPSAPLPMLFAALAVVLIMWRRP